MTAPDPRLPKDSIRLRARPTDGLQNAGLLLHDSEILQQAVRPSAMLLPSFKRRV